MDDVGLRPPAEIDQEAAQTLFPQFVWLAGMALSESFEHALVLKNYHDADVLSAMGMTVNLLKAGMDLKFTKLPTGYTIEWGPPAQSPPAAPTPLQAQ